MLYTHTKEANLHKMSLFRDHLFPILTRVQAHELLHLCFGIHHDLLQLIHCLYYTH